MSGWLCWSETSDTIEKSAIIIILLLLVMGQPTDRACMHSAQIASTVVGSKDNNEKVCALLQLGDCSIRVSWL